MKKTSFKKITALILMAALIMPVAVGCALVVYNEDRDMQQVVLRVESFEMEYNVPFYVEYKNSSGKTVYYDDGTPVMTVQRDEDGEPIHKPRVDSSGKIVYKTHDDWVKETEDITSDEYVISYTISGNEAVSATVYRYEGLRSDKVPAWRNIDTNDIVLSDSVQNPTAANKTEKGTKHADLPTIYFTKDDGSDWYYLYAEPEYVTNKWTTPAEEYTKQELINYYSRSTSQFEGQSLTLEAQFGKVIRGLYTLEFMYLEAENHIRSGEVVWDLTERNNLTKSFYNTIDNELKSIFGEIYSDFDKEFSGEEENDEDKSTTYPVPDAGDTSGAERDEYLWTPSDDYLGYGTSSERNSLVRAAIRRWISSLEDVIEDDNTISNAERKIYEEELATLNKLALSDEELVNIYTSLLDKNTDGTYKYSVMWYLYGESNDRNLKTSALQSYIESTADISENSILKRYYEQRDEQISIFNVNIESYRSTVSGGNSTMIYYADDSYFFVKHILLPFPESTTAELTKYKDTGRYSDISYNEFRKQHAPMDNSVAYPVYPHVNGENDTANVMTVSQAYAQIVQAVESQVLVAEKERAFEEMIFRFNTDPGIFNKDMGYAVSKTPAKDGGPAETYVIEFATAARELLEIGEGAMSKPVLGDYGYHILYLLKKPAPGEIMLYNQKITPGGTKTIRDLLSANITTDKYTSWSNDRASFYERDGGTDYFTIFADRYKDLYED